MSIVRPQPIAAKVEPYRCEAYLRHVARQPCLACGYAHRNEEGYICQAAHIGILGRGMKAPDYHVIPLCPSRFLRMGCHIEFDANQHDFARDELNCTLDELKLEAFADWQKWCREETK